MARIDPVDDNHEAIERAKAALRDSRRKRRIERQRWENEERQRKLYEEALRGFIAGGGNGGEGYNGTKAFHVGVVVS
jgi:hypothetical protein